MNHAGYIWRSQDCPICGHGAKRRMGTRGGASHRAGVGVECEIYRCATCGLVFPDPMPMPAGGVAQHYAMDPADYFSGHDQSDRRRHAEARLLEAESILGRRGCLLDVGSGRGEVVGAARDAGWEATALEPSPTFSEHITRTYGVLVVRDPIEHAVLEAGAYDVVLLGAVLEHLYEPDAVVAAIARALRPGGIIFVDVPNEDGLYFRVGNIYLRATGRDWVVNTAPTFPPYHVFGFTPRSLKMLLAKHGLEPVRWRVYGGTSMVSTRGSFLGLAEMLGARAVTVLSRATGLGTYIETWARKV